MSRLPNRPSSPLPARLCARVTTGDEVVVARIDLDQTKYYKGTRFDFERHRVPAAYESIAEAGVDAEIETLDLAAGPPEAPV